MNSVIQVFIIVVRNQQDWNTQYLSQFQSQTFEILSQITHKNISFDSQTSAELFDSGLSPYSPLHFVEQGDVIPAQDFFANLTLSVAISGIDGQSIIIVHFIYHVKFPWFSFEATKRLIHNLCALPREGNL
jgi:hypothetical protein